MADVFLSYKREDEAHARRVVDALRADGISVWWDKDIASGAPWRETIEEQLELARLTLVLWSRTSTGKLGGYVKEEAERARSRGAYLGVLIDDVPPAFGFGELQAVALGSADPVGRKKRMAHLIAVVRSRLDGTAPPAAVAATPKRDRKLLLGMAGATAALALGTVAWLGLGADRSPAPPARTMAERPPAGLPAFAAEVSNSTEIDENEKVFDFLDANDGKLVHLGLFLEHDHDNQEAAAAMDRGCNLTGTGNAEIWDAHVEGAEFRDRMMILPVLAKADDAAFVFRPGSLSEARLDCHTALRLFPLPNRPFAVERHADGSSEVLIKGYFMTTRMTRGPFTIYRLRQVDSREAKAALGTTN